MNFRIFAIFDSKAAAFLNPFFLPERAQARRAFGTAVLDPNTEFSKWPGDYTLFEIGAFDSATGAVEKCQVHENLGTGLVLLAEFGKADMERRLGRDQLRLKMEDSQHADAESSAMTDTDYYEERKRREAENGAAAETLHNQVYRR